MASSTLPVLASSNEYYAVGLAVALRSLVAHADPRVAFRIRVIDGGIRNDSWCKIVRTVEEARAGTELVRLTPSLARFEGLEADYGASHLAYARLLIDELFEEPRVLYVDSDIVFRRDCVELFETDLEGQVVAACQDLPIGVLGREHMDCAALELDPQRPYFNSGLLLIDLTRWKREQVRARTLEYLRTHADRCPYWDQSALNVTLYDRWLRLGPAWNLFHSSLADPPAEVDVAKSNLHFVGARKPWLHGSADEPGAELFHTELALTRFADHRPSRWARVESQTTAWFERIEDLGDRAILHATPEWAQQPDESMERDMHTVCRSLLECQIVLNELRVVGPDLEELVVLTFT